MERNSAIVIAEDSPLQAEVLRRSLTENGYQAIVARNGAEALAKIREQPPILVISDIEMPVMDGYTLCSAIKNDAKLQEIPVILLTTFAAPDDVIRGLNCKADNYLTKPYDESYLLRRIESLIINKRLRIQERVQATIEIFLGGKTYTIDSSRRQILDLLISTFENAVHQKRELEQRTEELEAAKAELQDKYRQLQELELSRDNLTHMIVHDMRSPLIGMIGFLQFLKLQAGDKLTAQESDYLNRAMRSTASLTEMVTAVLDVSKLEAGKMQLDIAAHDLGQLIKDALESLGSLVQQTPVSVPPTGVRVSCDGELIRRVILNLVSNAIKFTPKEGEVKLTIETGPGVAKLLVTDTGPGIPAEHHAKIFEKFGLVTKNQKYSTGLGLSFCKLAIEAHGGKVGLVSEMGHGSTFWFTLPIA